VSSAVLPAKYASLPQFSFGDSPALANELGGLVISGRKTATCTTPSDPNLSRPGDRWVVLDGAGRPTCVIETVEITMRRYDEVDATFAYDEGEDDRSLDAWRRAHRNYFTRQGTFGETMMLVCERFRLVEVLDDRGAEP
jgi:uncharacterized protein YhfF